MYNGGFENSQWSCVLWFVFVFWPVWIFSSFYEYHCDNHKRKKKLKLESQRNTSKPQHAYYTKEINSLSPNMKRYLKIFYHFPHSHDLYVWFSCSIIRRSYIPVSIRAYRFKTIPCVLFLTCSFFKQVLLNDMMCETTSHFFFQKRVAGNLFWHFFTVCKSLTYTSVRSFRLILKF